MRTVAVAVFACVVAMRTVAVAVKLSVTETGVAAAGGARWPVRSAALETQCKSSNVGGSQQRGKQPAAWEAASSVGGSQQRGRPARVCVARVFVAFGSSSLLDGHSAALASPNVLSDALAMLLHFHLPEDSPHAEPQGPSERAVRQCSERPHCVPVSERIVYQ